MKSILLLLLVACSRHPDPVGRAAARGLPPVDGPSPTSLPAILEGSIEAAPALRDQLKPGDVIYVSARLLDASGQPQRVPLAVDRLEVHDLPVKFSLTAANVMIPGTPFSGKVRLTARDDRDGDAATRSAGDIEGTLDAAIPARGLKIVLDTAVAP